LIGISSYKFIYDESVIWVKFKDSCDSESEDELGDERRGRVRGSFKSSDYLRYPCGAAEKHEEETRAGRRAEFDCDKNARVTHTIKTAMLGIT
jgi:hypothetical protein